MFSRELLLIGSLISLVMAIPFPPSVTTPNPGPKPTNLEVTQGGNFQPNKTTHSGLQILAADASGETVHNSALAVWSINNKDGIGGGSDSYKFYRGDGTTGAGWPDKTKWVSFENMFNNNKNTMFASCEQFKQADDSGPEVGAIYDGIQKVAIETGVDHRFILAVIMQESNGCVRVPTTNYGVRNPGLMQDHDGSATCNDNGSVQNPCPTGTIAQMIRDGTAGTKSGDGLANCINQSEVSDSSAFYKAARIYNSGSIAASGNLGDGIATHCYSSDIANRLTGWVNAASSCTLDG